MSADSLRRLDSLTWTRVALHVHYHVLVTDGLYEATGDDAPLVLHPPTARVTEDDERAVAEHVPRREVRLFRRRGWLASPDILTSRSTPHIVWIVPAVLICNEEAPRLTEQLARVHAASVRAEAVGDHRLGLQSAAGSNTPSWGHRRGQEPPLGVPGGYARPGSAWPPPLGSHAPARHICSRTGMLASCVATRREARAICLCTKDVLSVEERITGCTSTTAMRSFTARSTTTEPGSERRGRRLPST